MTLILTPDLQKHLGILPLQLKASRHDKHAPVAKKNDVNTPVIPAAQQSKPAVTESAMPKPAMPKPTLEKNEFRLLVKILQAIGHECVFNHITYKGKAVHYAHPKKTLIFDDITVKDDADKMHLSSLQDMNDQPQLKRAVWEKLKTLS
ncbi:hypothetical protein [Marinicella rhabdoformis]|uniref:hypothetical protein n=1 Tax=Marinicella rhabdoformis TaxID=2580566 RepID=UPI0012AEBE25|nr:hypothetical protein [Marinicella rhabdoformis]